MTAAFTESVVEDAVLALVLEARLRQALARLKPDLPPEAIDDAYARPLRNHGGILRRAR